MPFFKSLDDFKYATTAIYKAKQTYIELIYIGLEIKEQTVKCDLLTVLNE